MSDRYEIETLLHEVYGECRSYLSRMVENFEMSDFSVLDMVIEGNKAARCTGG